MKFNKILFSVILFLMCYLLLQSGCPYNNGNNIIDDNPFSSVENTIKIWNQAYVERDYPLMIRCYHYENPLRKEWNKGGARRQAMINDIDTMHAAYPIFEIRIQKVNTKGGMAWVNILLYMINNEDIKDTRDTQMVFSETGGQWLIDQEGF